MGFYLWVHSLIHGIFVQHFDNWTMVLFVFLETNIKRYGRGCLEIIAYTSFSLRWRYNGLDSVSNHQPHDCLLNRSFGRRSKKTSKLRVTGLCVGNSPVTGEFPAQMASNAENVSIWWRHHVLREIRLHIIRSLSSKHGLTLIPGWISNYIHYKVWYEITYPFTNFNGATVEVWVWISDFILHFTWHVIIYPCCD